MRDSNNCHGTKNRNIIHSVVEENLFYRARLKFEAEILTEITPSVGGVVITVDIIMHGNPNEEG